MKAIRAIVFILGLAIIICLNTGHIALTSYYDDGRVLRIWFFGAELTLIDEPAREGRRQ